MRYDKHPLHSYLSEKGESLTAYARRAGVSRTHLYRILSGENTTMTRIRQLSEATGGAVQVSEFVEYSGERA